MATVKHQFQLYEGAAGGQAGKMITATGGVVMVCKTGTSDKETLTAKDGSALANPLALTAGGAEFYAPTTSAGVDLYIMAPGGQFVVVSDVEGGSTPDIQVDMSRNQVAVIPFSITDSVAATEKDTGFDLPAKCFVLDRLHGCGVRVTTLDATEDIDVGILSTESGGDANGLIAASDLDNATLVIGTNGALFSTNAPHASDSITGKSISYTLTTGTDTAKGFIILPYVLTS